VIILRDLWYKYPNSNEYVLKGLNFRFNGKTLVIQGPNGSGKTTLLKIIACMLKPEKGEILVDNVNPWKLDDKKRLSFRRNIVYVHERPIFLRGSVIDNVTYPLRIRGLNEDKSVIKALKFLKRLGVEDIAYRKVGELSAGQLKLSSLARALVIEPKYLLLDEPLAYLDKNSIEVTMKVLEEIVNLGTKVIIASHIKVPLKTIDSKLTLFQGEIVEHT